MLLEFGRSTNFGKIPLCFSQTSPLPVIFPVHVPREDRVLELTPINVMFMLKKRSVLHCKRVPVATDILGYQKTMTFLQG